MDERIAGYLTELTRHPDRHVGGVGNRAATAMFAERVGELGFGVECTTFDCIEWEYGAVDLQAGAESFELLPGPYSLPCKVRTILTCASTVEEVLALEPSGAVLLLYGAIAAGQVMPKNFTFYNPESHKQIVRAIESLAPAAVIAATGRDPHMVGSQYPYPLFEDGDLDIPNAYMKDVDGARLAVHEGNEVALTIDSRRVPTTAEHIVARLQGSGEGRIVVTAHIDSRKDSPGALDNASGVATLLALAELLGDYAGGPSIELVPFNGEDNYANPGEMLWVAENEGRFDEIILGINIDDLGLRDTVNHVSFYGCPPEIEQPVRAMIAKSPEHEEGPQWFQSDHAIFGIYNRPALALACSDIEGFMANYAHSDRDTLELADPALISAAARFIREVIERVT